MTTLSPATIRQRIAVLEAKMTELDALLQRASYEALSDPADPAAAETKTTADQAITDAKAELGVLRAALPVAERIEAEHLAKVQAELRAGLVKKVRREAKALVDGALRYEAATANLCSAAAAMTKAGAAIRDLLPPELKSDALGFHRAMAPAGIETMAKRYLQKLGATGVPKAPFSLADVPTIAEELKRWTGGLMVMLDPPKPTAEGEAA